MMSLRLLSSSRFVAPYLRQSSLQAHTSAILLNSKDSSSSSSSSDSSDLDSNKEDEKIKKFDEKTPSEISKDAGATLKTPDSNEKLNILLQKISQTSPKTKTSLSNAEKEIKIEGLPSFLSSKTKSTDAISKKAKIEAKDVDDASSSSSSSSSDSSDSDSDREDQKVKRFSDKTSLKSSDSDTTLKISETNERLNMLLKNINETSQKTKSTAQKTKKEIKIEGLPSFISSNMKPKDGKITKSKAKDKDDDTSTKGKTINVAIKPKKIRFNQVSEEEKLKQKPYEHQIKQAAKDVAEVLGGDAQKTELELLTKALNLKQESPDSVSLSKEEKSLDLRGLLAKMKADTVSPDGKVDTKSNLQRAKMKFTEPSVAESILYRKSITRPKRYQESPADELRLAYPVMGILKKISKENKDGLQLPTWNAMEVREMRLATLTVPQNVFQELIQWTNEGKIWHFPIDNEQGMEAEKNVHFSEHVFMERHLKGWCPKKGPIRHFMELVCNGLSKNPYTTVEEKIEHITWYKNYFEDKKELLHELGVLDTPTPSVSSTDKKKIEA